MSSSFEIPTSGLQPPAAWVEVLTQAAKEVFSLMVGVEVSTPSPEHTGDGLDVTAMVGMAGQICGVLSVACNKSVATMIASRMLGLTGGEASQHSCDAIGEVCNMIAGSFKTKLGLEDKCMLSVPTVIIGEDYTFHTLVVTAKIEAPVLFEHNLIHIALDLRS